MNQNIFTKLIPFFVLFNLIFFMTSAYGLNMSYVEVNSNRLDNVRCYIRTDNQKPFFDITAIFAANINGSDPNQPEIFFNEHVKDVLQSSQIENLQKNGIKVLITLLGNHQNAGWSCMTNEKAVQKFADEVVSMVNQYHLDGVDIDDEYSRCTPNNYSMIMLAQAIKSHPNFKNKLLTKALFADQSYFKVDYKGHRLAEYLDYGWEMTYSYDRFDARMAFYLQNGMKAKQLMIGGWANNTYPDPYLIGLYTLEHSLAGVMIYDVTRYSQPYLTQILKGLINKNVAVETIPSCLAG